MLNDLMFWNQMILASDSHGTEADFELALDSFGEAWNEIKSICFLDLEGDIFVFPCEEMATQVYAEWKKYGYSQFSEGLDFEAWLYYSGMEDIRLLMYGPEQTLYGALPF